MSNSPWLAWCNTVFCLPVKTNSDDSSTSVHCNQVVSQQRRAFQHKYTHLIKQGSDWSLIWNYPPCTPAYLYSIRAVSSHIAKLARCKRLFRQKHPGEVGPVNPPSSPTTLVFFHSTIRLTCWRILLCPVAPDDISGDMIIANGCRKWLGHREMLQHYI